jgi:signal transduction histidine kinase
MPIGELIDRARVTRYTGFVAKRDAKAAGDFQGRLFRKYTVYLAGLLSVALLVSGLVGLYFSYRDTRSLVDELAREKARAAATRIEQFIRNVETQLRGVLPLRRADEHADAEQRYIELLKLLRLAPAVSDAAWIDSAGRERVRVSRVTRDVVASAIDRSDEAAFTGADAVKAWYSPVYFRRETEPYLTMAVKGSQRDAGVIIAEVNLKFVWDIVATIRSGAAGHAYIVDVRGRLISHPDISRVLRITDLSALPQVRAALSQWGGNPEPPQTMIARDDTGVLNLAAYAPIEGLDWSVLVEQPLVEAFAPLYGSALRSMLVLLLGIALAAGASIVLARRMVAPIRTLDAGARRIGEGKLDERVVVESGDELQDLAQQFNLMARKLHDSYSGLEQKIEERTQQLAEANRAKSRFLAAASHDLRQPVHALGLFVAQLQEARDARARERIIEKVEASTTAVSELIEALLDISKLDAGAVQAQPAEFALHPLLDRVEQAFSIAAQAKGLRLRVRKTRLRVATDPVLLERIVLNLAANAVRYTREGGIVVGARKRGACVRIDVWDTGIGIAPHEQAHIFEEFYRVSGAPGDSSQGLGLGLAIVDRLARLLGLSVQVRSVAGRGSVFAIEVPAAVGATIAFNPVSEAREKVRFDGLTVLIIDDDAAVRDAAAGLLAQWGCETLLASSGAQAEDLLDAGAAPPLVIISDYRLAAGELGTEVVQRLRARLGGNTPAVIVSADASALSAQAVTAAGMHLLRKPLRPANLRAVLHHVLRAAPVHRVPPREHAG